MLNHNIKLLLMCDAVQRPSDTSQWISGTSTWGQKVAENENDWTKVPSVAPGSSNYDFIVSLFMLYIYIIAQ